jgi:DNA-binding CsgD family transcriptional regulator
VSTTVCGSSRTLVVVASPPESVAVRAMLLLLEEACDKFGLSSREREILALSPREREILALLARGETNSEIGEALWIAPSTVRRHLEKIYAKLGVRTRTAAVACFLGAGDDEARHETTFA